MAKKKKTTQVPKKVLKVSITAKEYTETLALLKAQIQETQLKAALSVSKELIKLYWSMGETIIKRQEAAKWGSGVIEQLTKDLQNTFPGIEGFSKLNIYRIQAFYRAYEKVSQAVTQLESLPIFNIPWGHNIVLMHKLKKQDERLWYAQQAIENGWSRSMLETWIKSKLHNRQGKAVSNFSRTMPTQNSDLAQQSLKDPYIFDFLTLKEDYVERDIEQGLTNQIQKFLLELGKEFAFVGRQYHLEVDGDDYYIDLLFYHLRLHCYTVIELKNTEFKPEYAGKLNFYISAIDDLLRHEGDNPTIGLILCKTKKNSTVEYTLKGVTNPIGVAEYETKLVESLQKNIKSSLPTIKEIEAGLKKIEAPIKKITQKKTPKPKAKKLFLKSGTHKNKIVLLFFYFFLSCSTSILASEPTDKSQDEATVTQAIAQDEKTQSETFYDIMACENLKAMNHVRQKQAINFDFEHFDAKAWYKAEFEALIHPEPIRRREAMFTLLSNFKEKNPLTQTEVLDRTTWQELEILCGPISSPIMYLAAQLDRTVTEAGRVTLYRKLVNPVSDFAQLENQRAIVTHLVNNETLFNELDTKLKALVEPENLMICFWYEGSTKSLLRQARRGEFKVPLASKVTQIKNFQNWLNKKPAVWLASSAKQNIFTCISRAMLLYWFLAVPTYVLSGTDIASYLPADIYESKWIPKAKDLAHFSTFSLFTMAGIASWLFSQACEGHEEWERVEGLYKGGYTLWDQIESVQSERESILENNEQNKNFYAEVVYVARYINGLKAMAQLVAHDEVLATRIPKLRAFSEYLATLDQTSQDMKYLLELLETKTFDGNYSSWNIYWGRVKVAFTLIAELRDQFVDAIIAVGELDAQLSIAKLCKEFQNKRVTFCIPTFIDPQTVNNPSVNITDFWNPFINPEKVIPSSLAIGPMRQKPQNVIITGPNASGKSTITKAFIISVILAQSLGIAPAKELTLTPFNKIITYMNITDDIAAGNSHFKAGVLRARDVAKTFEKLKTHEFGLTAIDEVFNGTTFHEGQAAAYSLIKILGAHPLGMCITNTHFHIIPSLEQSTGHFMNYKVSVIDRPGEKIQYPFILERGTSSQNVAFKILREEGFGDEFLDQAQQVLDGKY